jgi:hypothetical protein
MNHLKQHWWKYYLGVGGVWTALNLYHYPSTRTVGAVAKEFLAWPLDVYQTFAQYGTLLPAVAGGSSSSDAAA